MEEFDGEKAARVWERVLKREDLTPLEPRKTDLTPLVLSAQELAGLYHAAARQLGGKEGELVRGLLRQQKGMVACLKGICQISGGRVPKFPGFTPPREPARRLLESCYHRERRLLGELSRHVSDPEFGQVFRSLAEGAGKRCLTVLEILGRMKG